MRLNRGDQVAGLPATDARELLRRFDQPQPEGMIGSWIDIGSRTGAEVARAFEDAGYLKLHGVGGHGETWWESTIKGGALAQARIAASVTWSRGGVSISTTSYCLASCASSVAMDRGPGSVAMDPGPNSSLEFGRNLPRGQHVQIALPHGCMASAALACSISTVARPATPSGPGAGVRSLRATEDRRWQASTRATCEPPESP